MKSLREHLDDIGVHSGDDRGFTVIHNGTTEMCVSRRYLESDPMKHYLDMNVFHIDLNHTDIFGRRSVCFWLMEQFDSQDKQLL